MDPKPETTLLPQAGWIRMKRTSLLLLTTVWMLAAYNLSFWQRAMELFQGKPWVLFAFATGIAALMMAYLLLFAHRCLLKPALIANLLIAASASYFHENMGIFVDREMIQNVVTTTTDEAKHIITWSFVWHMLIFGILPSIFVWCVTLTRTETRRGAILVPAAQFCLCILIAVTCVALNFKTLSFTLRENRDLMKRMHPIAPVDGAVKFALMAWEAENRQFTQIGLDAKRASRTEENDHPTLVVLVIGETVRDQNWGLSGYERNTTPELAKRDILAIPTVSSCGTATAVSMPCMFSKFARSDYSYELGSSHENLLDLLQRAGYAVEWWDVNTGHKGVADRVLYRNFYGADDPTHCHTGECTDGLLLQKLTEAGASISTDTVIVLHQIGNHGPAYYLRYPEATAPFTPDCRAADLANCTREEVVNAYDNAVSYTDQILAETIDYLDGLSNLNTAMVYVSDHGESLGENGLYLHGLPYIFAPPEQKTVPMVVWMSERFRTSSGLNYNCAVTKDQISHDNYFHSILGLMGVETEERQADLNIFRACPGETHSGAAS